MTLSDPTGNYLIQALTRRVGDQDSAWHNIGHAATPSCAEMLMARALAKFGTVRVQSPNGNIFAETDRLS